MTVSDDRRHMARALQLAERGLYSTDPNPRVGCVIVAAGEVVGEGWHERAGGPHAEVHALQAAGAKALGATAYVTLEPCSHHGRTPPCADALIRAGIARVVVAMEDPNPQVAGGGLQRLRGAGIDVESGLMAAQAEALNPGFLKRMRTGRPFVRVKIAASLDGRTAMASGESQWITGPEARADVQRLRARSSAIVTGIGTLLADRPALTVRETEMGGLGDHASPGRQPLRVVLDSRLRSPLDAPLFQQAGNSVVLTTRDSLQNHSVQAAALSSAGVLVEALGETEAVDLAAVLDWLGARGCNEVLVEAGPTLAGAFLSADLVDEFWLYQAPVLLGSEARPLVDLPIQQMADRLRLRVLDRRMVGQDQRLVLGVGE
ncbi:bifunctional diaminohydroxyphosphoribosylaminopyrimidine deaminase/5-amino-6-(5-phosphoribosylamino)uracil reductase RibD [Mangrovitalea sediminis]|uniref:bifunctional diaminohydroxyphosphoribosylaminopyrimidine deaminase/5-amino-6-(5-phosphoribosylamino)uracil reductase RibD n=1 Tax=Mangrovitalea sediminis TaxID=1982043 RepID=UPI000BE60014|nr:bifunctional diaminohydroxyphosphoribosylaminopyrimidine deaminase/5-amino-6-(5-phosphoribosylamino)uracil reductase RibD [Mangrovitalea sediminis]